MIQLPDIHDDHDLLHHTMYVLQYYACFRHPVTPAEIAGSCPVPVTPEAVKEALQQLVRERKAYTCKGFYSTLSQIDEITGRRLKGNRLAEELFPKAVATGRFIAGFPFVRFVGISGSLSKGYAEQGVTDYDFFIITAADRLWICRTMLHLFKKATFLLGLQGRFCMNYFIDSDSLRIEEENFYTAIEISSLVPVSGQEVYDAFIQANEWRHDHLPNGYKNYFTAEATPGKMTWYKKMAEAMLDLFMPGRLNAFFMRLTDKWWRRKWARKNYPADQYELAFKTTLHHSKNHPANYQKKVLDQVRVQMTKMPAGKPAGA
jgi:hypothetical protein